MSLCARPRRSGRPPQPFVYQTLGMMGSLGHSRGFGRLLGVRVRGFPAWFIRRTYYLLQMPGWGRRLRTVIDWTFALLFRPDVIKVSLESESALLLREVAFGDAAARQQEEGGGKARNWNGDVRIHDASSSRIVPIDDLMVMQPDEETR